MTTEQIALSSNEFGFDELRERCLNNTELLRKVLDAFTSSFSRNLNELQCHADASDWSQVRKTAHKMKGGAANAAAYRLQQLSACLEQAAEDQQVETCGRLIAQLWTEWTSFLNATSNVNLSTVRDDCRTR